MPWGYAAAGVGSAVAGSLLSKGGSGGTVQTQSSQEPWVGVQPHLSSLFDRANLQSYAAPSPFTTNAQRLQAEKALDPNSLTAQSQGMIGSTIAGNYLDPNTNPYFHNAVQDALGQAGSSFAGQYGGNAGSNLSNSGYQEGLARTLGNVATNAYSNQYGAERQNQLNASQMAPGLDYASINQLGAVGAAQDAYPWQQLQNYQSAISGAFGGQGTQQTPYFTNPLATAMGLGIGGLTAYNGMKQGGAFGSPQQATSVPFYTGYGIGGDNQYG